MTLSGSHTFSRSGRFILSAVSGLLALISSSISLPAAAQDSLPINTRTFLLGLSHHPAHRRGETPQDVQQAMGAAVSLAAQNSEVFSVWTLKDWYQEWEGYYAKPAVAQRKAYFDLMATHYRLMPIFNVNFWTLVPKPGRGLVLVLVAPPDLAGPVTLADREWRRRWLEHVTRVARERQVRHWDLSQRSPPTANDKVRVSRCAWAML
jgi:hypothetical protein